MNLRLGILILETDFESKIHIKILEMLFLGFYLIIILTNVIIGICRHFLTKQALINSRNCPTGVKIFLLFKIMSREVE